MIRNIPQESGVLLLIVEDFTDEEKILKDGKSLADFSLLDRIGGTTIGCDHESLERWHDAYYRTMRSYLEMGRFIGKDQSMMATTCLETDLCLLVVQGGGGGEGCQDEYYQAVNTVLNIYIMGNVGVYSTC